MVKVIKGLSAKWRMCSCIVMLDSITYALSYHNNSIVVASKYGDITILDVVTGS